MDYEQAVAIMTYEINNASRRCEELGMTKKPRSNGRPALFQKQYWGTVTDLTGIQKENGTYPLVPCFTNGKGEANVTSKIFTEVWLPKIHHVVSMFECIPEPELEDDQDSRVNLSDNKLDAWVYRLDALDPFVELGITARSVKALLAKANAYALPAAEKMLKLTVIDLMFSVHCVHSRAAKNEADETFEQTAAREQGKA
jgi:hypothetical protein